MACLDDNTLLAFVERALPADALRSVSEHLDHCEECLTIACAVARSEADTLGGDDISGVSATLPREMIGRYALIEMIGRGGMGSVFVAHDPQLDRRVALKVVRAERFEGPEIRARLSREARAMAKVDHPHVVTVYDAGELPDGVFIAMELVDGTTLGRWLADAPRSWREITRLFGTIGRGLAAAHAAGIVHRDFKPDNVLVDRAGRAAVTDFGLAVAEAAPVLDLAPATPIAEAMERSRTGALVGTPLYMSPEQLAGAPLDARSDQFSFAIALYEALYQQKPFAGATIGALMEQVLAGKLRARPARTAVPARVHRVIERALRTEPAARYPAMGPLLDALEAAARPAWRGAAAGTGVVALAAIGALMLTRGPDASAPPPPPGPGSAELAALAPPAPVVDLGVGAPRLVVLVAPFANHTGDARLDDTLDVALQNVLYRSTRIDPVAGVELAEREARTGAGSAGSAASIDDVVGQVTASGRSAIVVRGTIAADPDGGFALALDARGTRGVPVQLDTRVHAASADGALAAAEELGVVLRLALGDPPPVGSLDHVLSRSLDAVHLYAIAVRLAARGDNEGAARENAAAITADPGFVEAHAALGLALYNLGRLAEAGRELEIAARDSDHMAERQRLGLLGDFDGTVGRYEEGVAAYEQLLAKWPGDGRTEVNITATALDGGSFPLALELARRAVADHGSFAVTHANLVLADLANGQLDDAVRDGDAMLVAVPHPTPFGLCFLAMAHALRGEPDAARAIYARLAETEPELADGGRADLAIFEGTPELAEPLLAKWVDAHAARHPPGASDTEQLALAQLRLRRGDRAGAAAALARALPSAEASPHEAYLAASLAVDAGVTTGLADKARAWRDRDSRDWRMFGEMLDGDLALAAGRPPDAIAAYQRAGRIGRVWLQRARLGRAYLAAHQPAEAARELAWCRDHRAEAAIFMTPSLALLRPVEELAGPARPLK